MKTFPRLALVGSMISLVCFGCSKTEEKAKQYDIKGKVIAVNADKKSITIRHQDIPGYMKAMEMTFDVGNPNILEGIKSGDQVEGRLEVKPGGQAVITQLQKKSETSWADNADEEDIKAARAELDSPDRKLAEAQDVCPIGDSRLGSMGKPFKVMIRGQPVLLCCQGCEKKALANPEDTLAKVKELKTKKRETGAGR